MPARRSKKLDRAKFIKLINDALPHYRELKELADAFNHVGEELSEEELEANDEEYARVEAFSERIKIGQALMNLIGIDEDVQELEQLARELKKGKYDKLFD
jgi:hypothetical protein